jgi:hypothetical protein
MSVVEAVEFLRTYSLAQSSAISKEPRVQVPLVVQVVGTIAMSVIDPVRLAPLDGPYHIVELSNRFAPSHYEILTSVTHFWPPPIFGHPNLDLLILQP